MRRLRELPVLLAAALVAQGTAVHADAASTAGTPGVASSTDTPALRVADARGALQPFEATYRVWYRGMPVGASTLRLSRAEGDTWLYESRNLARGFARVFFPDPITQESRFRVREGVVLPLAYTNDDGSSATDRDVRLEFDWAANRVTGIARDKPVDVPLEPGTQDALSVQIALMRELAAGRQPHEFALIDRNEIKHYRYERENEVTVETGLGSVPAIVYRSQAPGSSRVTRLWLAPSLGYLPVRAEQRRGERIDFALAITAVSSR